MSTFMDAMLFVIWPGLFGAWLVTVVTLSAKGKY